MSEITKEELLAFAEANRQSATNLEKVAIALSAIVIQQDKILTKLQNGITKDITESFKTQCVGCKTALSDQLEEIKKDTGEAVKDIGYSKFFLGAVALVIIIATVFVNSIFRMKELTTVQKSEIQQIIKELK